MYIPPILMVNNELAADFAKTVNFLFDAINLKEAVALSNLDESTYENSLFFSYINTVFSYGDAAGTSDEYKYSKGDYADFVADHIHGTLVCGKASGWGDELHNRIVSCNGFACGKENTRCND